MTSKPRQSKAEALTQARVREVLHYDPETGVFTNRVWRGGNSQVGSVAGWTNGSDYVLVSVDGGQYLAHRLAWFYVHGVWPERDIDHRNHITTDNRLVNLRCGSRSQNNCNQIKARKDNKRGLLGVCWCKRKSFWRATITLNKKQKHIGYFDSAEQAHEAYLIEKRKLHSFNTL